MLSDTQKYIKAKENAKKRAKSFLDRQAQVGRLQLPSIWLPLSKTENKSLATSLKRLTRKELLTLLEELEERDLGLVKSSNADKSPNHVEENNSQIVARQKGLPLAAKEMIRGFIKQGKFIKEDKSGAKDLAILSEVITKANFKTWSDKLNKYVPFPISTYSRFIQSELRKSNDS
jgi:hypothetical protein